MSNVTLTFAGNNPGIASYALTMGNPDGTSTDMGSVPVGSNSFDFTAPTAPGAYTVTCQAMDASGSPLEAPINAAFTVAAPPVDNIPVTMVVTL